MRTVPPMVVSIAAGVVFFTAGVYAIKGSATMQLQNTEHQTIVSTQEESPTVEISSSELTYTQSPAPTYQSLVKSRDWDADESQMLMQIAMAEAEGEDTEGKALVMCVVLNRVWSEGFPDSIEEVIFQPKQFSPVCEGGRYYTTEADADCRAALEMVMSGWDESEGALYFESCENSSWHSQNLELLFRHGGHRFYR